MSEEVTPREVQLHNHGMSFKHCVNLDEGSEKMVEVTFLLYLKEWVNLWVNFLKKTKSDNDVLSTLSTGRS